MTDVDIEPLEVIPPLGHHRIKSVPTDYQIWQFQLSQVGMFTMACECGLLMAAEDMVHIARMWQRHIRQVVALEEELSTTHQE